MTNLLYEPDPGERFSRNQVKMLMMFVLGGIACPEPVARDLIAATFRAYDDPNAPLAALVSRADDAREE